MNARCYYHPSKEAEAICSQCKKPICLADTRQLTQTRNTSMGKSTIGNVTRETYRRTTSSRFFCIPCETNRIIKAEKKMNRNKACLLFLIVFMVCLISFSWVVGFDLLSINFAELNAFGDILEILIGFGEGVLSIGFLLVFIMFCCFIQSGKKKTIIAKEQAIQTQKEFEQNLT